MSSYVARSEIVAVRLSKAYDTCDQDEPFNGLMGTDNYGATSNNMKLVHCSLMGRLLHLVQRKGDWAGPQ